jgi:hypothetical protein
MWAWGYIVLRCELASSDESNWWEQLQDQRNQTRAQWFSCMEHPPNPTAIVLSLHRSLLDIRTFEDSETVYLKGSAVFRAISVKWKVRCYCYTWLCYLCNFLELCVWNRWQRLGITAMHLTGLVLDSVRNHNLIMTFLTQVHTTIFQALGIQWHWVWTFVFSSSLLGYV